MSGTNHYETLYGVGLLDDLHNYFPAILYDSGRFRTTSELLHYITTCVRNRFDLFSFGQRSYLNNTLEPPAPAPSSSQPHASNSYPQSQAPASMENAQISEEQPRLRTRRAAAGDAHIPNMTTYEPRISTHIEITQEDLGLDNQALSLLNLLNLFNGIPAIPRRQTNLPNSFLEPVVVRPSPEQIEAGSSRAFPAEETTCAICQDAIPVNQMARRLNACGHTFHISCIDQWFGRDVRCPTCRHDIREALAQPPAAAAAADSAPEEVN